MWEIVSISCIHCKQEYMWTLMLLFRNQTYKFEILLKVSYTEEEASPALLSFIIIFHEYLRSPNTVNKPTFPLCVKKYGSTLLEPDPVMLVFAKVIMAPQLLISSWFIFLKWNRYKKYELLFKYFVYIHVREKKMRWWFGKKKSVYQAIYLD